MANLVMVAFSIFVGLALVAAVFDFVEDAQALTSVQNVTGATAIVGVVGLAFLLIILWAGVKHLQGQGGGLG